jgi:hypothetical protein
LLRKPVAGFRNKRMRRLEIEAGSRARIKPRSEEIVMGRVLSLAFALAMGLCLPAAAQDALKTAGQVPTDVSEVVSGGNWSEGDSNGVFRAVVVTNTEGQTSRARVIVQMLAFEKGGALPKVAKTIPVKEVEEKKLPNAFLAMDVENDNELTLIITSYDAEKDQDTSMMVKLDNAGKYEIAPPAKEEPASAEPKAEGQK